MKSPSIAPAYACLYPGLAEVARSHGYALAIHGSVSTDLDLIAVPWTEYPSSAETLAHAITEHAAACLTVGCRGGNPERKPHGRLAWHLSLDAGACIDLSVMPLDHGRREEMPNRRRSANPVAGGGRTSYDYPPGTVMPETCYYCKSKLEPEDNESGRCEWCRMPWGPLGAGSQTDELCNGGRKP